MINRTYTLLNNLNEQLHFIDLETDNLVHKSEKALEICIGSINKLKKLISKYNFQITTGRNSIFQRNKTTIQF